MATITVKEISALTDKLVSTQDRVIELEKFVSYVAGLEAHADGLNGLVDYPHTKVLRAASRKARELLTGCTCGTISSVHAQGCPADTYKPKQGEEK